MATFAMKLVIIKVLHTIIWIMMVAVIGFVLWSGITGHVSIYSWLAVAVVCCEGLILLIFKGHCPLTNIARKYSGSARDNFDIYLPEWLARYNKQVFTTIFCIGLLLMLLHYPAATKVLQYIGYVLLLPVAWMILALPASFSLPCGMRPGIEKMTIDEAVIQLKGGGAAGIELVEQAQQLVISRMQYCRRNSFDSCKIAFMRGYGYCQQQAFALQYILSKLGYEARVVHAYRNRFHNGKVGGHAWVQVYDNGKPTNIDATRVASVAGGLTFQPLSKIKVYNSLFRLFSGWGSIGVNAIRYYKTGSDSE